MVSPGEDVRDDGGLPITLREMQTLLAPLRACLMRMEGALRELPSVPSNGDDKNTLPKSDSNRGACLSDFDFNGPLDNVADSCDSSSDGGPAVDALPTLSNDLNAPLPPGALASAANDASNFSQVVPSLPAVDSKHPSTHGDPSDKNGSPLRATSADVPRNVVTEMVEKHHIMKTMEEAERGIRSKMNFIDKVGIVAVEYNRKWNRIREPKYNNRIARLIRSSHFETLCISAIILNSIFVAYVADWQMHNIGHTETELISVCELIFFSFFLVELILRVCAHRCYYFVNNDMHWNIFDFTLVLISAVDIVVDKLVGAEAGANVVFMRLLRLLKLARIFRSLRSFRFFKSLATLLESFQKSFVSLFWGMVMLAFVLYIFSLIFMQALVEYLTLSSDILPKERSDIESNFGSLGLTILSLYKSVTGGSEWGDYYDMMTRTGTIYGFAFVFFTFFFLFALFNILTGTLVEKAMSSSKPDRTEQVLIERKTRAAQKHEFLEICHLMDADHNGRISWAEFQVWINNPVLFAYMSSLGIEIQDVELFFATVGARMERSGPCLKFGEVTIDHFVEGCMHMKGTATAIDMQRQLFEMHCVHHDLQHLRASFSNRLLEFEHSMEQQLTALTVAAQRHERARIDAGRLQKDPEVRLSL